jgi:serine/threonine protein kinase
MATNSSAEPGKAKTWSGDSLYRSADPAEWAILERFEQAWNSGQRPSIRDYVPPGGHHRNLLVDLIHIDLERRLKAGEMACIEGYLGRYPELRGDRAIVLELIVAELQKRKCSDGAVSVQEFFCRFPEYREELIARVAEQEAPGAAGPAITDSDSAKNLGPSRSPGPRNAASENDSTHEFAVQKSSGPPAARDPRETIDPIPASLTVVAVSWPKIKGYEILGELGRGSKTIVYHALHLRLNRVVALKMLGPDRNLSSEDLVRFLNEAEVVARLQHPNIVQIYEVGAHERGPFFTMEYLKGGRLDQMLAGTPLLARPAARVVETLALAVHAAHQHGVIHRDLKPANVLLAQPPRARTQDSSQIRGLKQSMLKLIDFGLAKCMQVGPGLTREGDLLGTPSYMAPEQANGNLDQIGPLTDVYGLGAILYELLTGRPPFKAATILRTVSQVLHVKPVAPSRLDPKLAPDIEAICLKCLAKDAQERYVSAAALAEDLWRFLNGRPAAARGAAH